MNESKKRFVDQLLAADPPSSEARLRYEKGMQAMFEMKLTPYRRREHLAVAIIMGLIGLSMTIVYGLNVFIDWPFQARPDRPDLKFGIAFFLLTAMALLAVAAICFRAYSRGVVNRRASNDWTAGTAVVYAGLVGCVFFLMSLHLTETLRDEVRMLGLALLGFAAIASIRHCVVRAELRTAEKLLEIELRLAEIGEALEGKTSSAGQASAHLPPPT